MLVFSGGKCEKAFKSEFGENRFHVVTDLCSKTSLHRKTQVASLLPNLHTTYSGPSLLIEKKGLSLTVSERELMEHFKSGSMMVFLFFSV